MLKGNKLMNKLLFIFLIYVIIGFIFSLIYQYLYNKDQTCFSVVKPIVKKEEIDAERKKLNDLILEINVTVSYLEKEIFRIKADTCNEKISEKDYLAIINRYCDIDTTVSLASKWEPTSFGHLTSRIIPAQKLEFIPSHISDPRFQRVINPDGSEDYVQYYDLLNTYEGIRDNIMEEINSITKEIAYINMYIEQNFAKSLNIADFIYYSLITMATLGFGDIVPNSTIIRILVTAEVLIGFFIAVVAINIVVTSFKN